MQISFVLTNFLKKRFNFYQELNCKFQEKSKVMEKVNADESENTKVVYNQKKDQDERRRILEALKSLSNVEFSMDDSPIYGSEFNTLSLSHGHASPGTGLKTEISTAGQLHAENSFVGLGAGSLTVTINDAHRKSRKKEGFLLVDTIPLGQGGGHSKASMAMTRLGGWKKVINKTRAKRELL